MCGTLDVLDGHTDGILLFFKDTTIVFICKVLMRATFTVTFYCGKNLRGMKYHIFVILSHRLHFKNALKTTPKSQKSLYNKFEDTEQADIICKADVQCKGCSNSQNIPQIV